MSGTPRSALTVTQKSAGARWIDAYANRKPYEIIPIAAYETRRTPRRPKYSLMTSVRMKTMGQMSTPAVKLSDPCWPNKSQPNGGRPSVFSSAKILTPTNSATTALPTKNAVSRMKRRVERAPSKDTDIGGFPCLRGICALAGSLLEGARTRCLLDFVQALAQLLEHACFPAEVLGFRRQRGQFIDSCGHAAQRHGLPVGWQYARRSASACGSSSRRSGKAPKVPGRCEAGCEPGHEPAADREPRAGRRPAGLPGP